MATKRMFTLQGEKRNAIGDEPVFNVVYDDTTEGVVVNVANATQSLATTALTLTRDSHNGRIIVLNHTGAASTVTLPAATGSGARYTFIVGAVNTSNHVIKVANATDVFEGIAIMAADDAGGVTTSFESGASDDTITLNGTTTGGAAIGDRVEIIDYASGKFHVLAHLSGTGTEATPFSATVS